jgi:hypothetical protein
MPQPTTSQDSDLPLPNHGEIYRVLPDGRWALWFDNHLISNFTECEQKFVYNSIKRLRLKGPDRPCISIGQWWSLVSEKFYTRFAVEGPLPVSEMAQIAAQAWVENSMDSMASFNPDAYEDFAMPTDASLLASLLGLPGFDHVLMMQYKKQAETYRKAAEVLCSEDPAEYEKLNAMATQLENKTTLALGPILMAVQYYATYAEQDFRDWKIIGAEKPFGRANEVMIGEDDKVVVYYMGKPDLVIYEKSTDQLMPLDQKTKDYVDKHEDRKWKPNSQLAGYVYACQHMVRELGYDRPVDRCLVSVCGRKLPAKPRKKGESPKPRFKRVRATYSVQEIEEWRSTIMKKARRLRHALEFNEVTRVDGFLCHLFAGCDYRRVCAVPDGTRDIVIRSDYVQVKPWSPYEKEDEK